jgi:hypothetical protein
MNTMMRGQMPGGWLVRKLSKTGEAKAAQNNDVEGVGREISESESTLYSAYSITEW